jgi:hypothetical protein
MVSRCVSPYHSWSHESARYSLLLRHAKVWNLASSPQMAPGRAEMTMFHVTIPIGSMVLVYMLTWLGYIDGIHVTIYSIHGSYGLLIQYILIPSHMSIIFPRICPGFFHLPSDAPSVPHCAPAPWSPWQGRAARPVGSTQGSAPHGKLRPRCAPEQRPPARKWWKLSQK